LLDFAELAAWRANARLVSLQLQSPISEDPMSALPPKADISRQAFDVCFVPEADMVASLRVVRFTFKC